MPKDLKILQSKLLVPRTAHAIKRERLERVRSNLSRKRAIIVSAGPGYGKTTFIAQVVADVETVWFRLEASDSDFQVFLTYLIHGIRKYYDGFGDKVLSVMQEAGVPGIDRDVLIRLIQVDLESLVEGQLVIVLDDYHHVNAVPEIKQAIQFFIEHLPSNIHFIIIARYPVDLALSRLRASLEIMDISMNELLFSKTETEQLFLRSLKMPLTSSQIDLLHDKTDGWISGLILFYHSLPGEQAGAVLKQLRQLKGSRGIIFDYMDENIFDVIDAGLQAFLMKTSLLSHVNADQCNRILGIENAGAILEHLSSINMFTFCLDHDNNDYCYHHLFQDFLVKKLTGAKDKQTLRQLHISIAEILEETGEDEDAIRHYIKADNYTDACRLIAANVTPFIGQLRIRLIDEYMTMLPAEVIESHPWVLFLRANAGSFSGQFRRAMQDVTAAYELFRTANNDEGMNMCLADMGTRYYLTGDFIKAESVFRELLANSTITLLTRVETLGHLIFITSYLYDFGSADRFIAEAETLLDSVPGYIPEEIFRSWFLLNRSLRLWAAGDFDDAMDEAEKTLPLLIRSGNTRLLPLYHQIMAMLYHHKGSFQKGIDEALAGLAVIEKTGFKETAMGWLLCFAGANALGLGRYDDAERYGEECLQLFQYLESPWGIGTGYHILQNTCLAAGKYEASVAMGKKGLEVTKQENYPLTHASLKAYLAEALLFLDKTDDAAVMLHDAEKLLDKTTILDCQFAQLHAHIAEKRGDRETAMQKTEECLRLVSKNGPGNHFIFDKAWMIPCLIQCHAAGIYKREVEFIIGSMGDVAVAVLTRIGKEAKGRLAKAVRTIKTSIPGKPPADLTIFCFGRFRLFLGDKELTPESWKSKKARTLLKLMIHYRAQGYVSKDVFIEHLWPDEDPVKTAKRFHVALAAVRKALEPNIERGISSAYIKSEMDSYHLYIGDNGYLDILEFDTAYQKAVKETEQIQRVKMLRSAVELYHGAYFAEDLYDDWCIEKRERFQSQYLNILMEIIRYYDAAQEYSHAIEYCQRYLKEDNYAERIYQRLMRYYALSSGLDMVRKIYSRCHDSIVNDLGCPLSRETELLLQELIADRV